MRPMAIAARLFLPAVVYVASGCPGAAICAAQAASPTAPSPAQSFEVATIKPADPAARGISFEQSADSITIHHASLRDLIRSAWGLKTTDQIEQGPAWIGSEAYDVSAKMSDADAAGLAKLDRGARFDARRRMLQALLTARFHLKVTETTGQRPVYALTIAKGGSKLEDSTRAASPAATASSPSSGLHPALRFRDDHLIATSYSMALFADWLSAQPAVDGRIVVDQTGLPGNYDFTLDGWVPKVDQPLDVTSTQPDQGKTLFAVLEQQLGLRLISTKAPVPVVVVEHAEQPSPN